ncbi:methyl-accepting chemotaxis protein [Paenibacillus silvae]|uniref:Methyl-accepting chemotaxis protein n=1 Tax=Paenibacillus silvae TaxID=1325358 RepID=A0ABQ1YYG1_9BACL|nr:MULTISPECIES: methyl-accepting chemotaxis protein [Paenibacillus]MCK6076502.1 methyl-accepting chemotaxis protein [Paenibacillus silvae]MCK6150929.1 methyl-accepting chemotaxis protein [Paenibacillus silvae]MCK6269189.1 methyl-accepting chemotaxis protein [Paenibacillus silvae]GGH41679.1 methyl-accepting chemotaxis protein [Paenibacillus silvae]
MKWFSNLRTATKIISAFLVVSLVLATLGIYSIFTLRGTNDRMEELYNNNLVSVRELTSAQVEYQRLRVNIRDLNNEKVAAEQTRITENMASIRQSLEERFATYRPLATTAEESEMFRKLESQYENYMKLYDQGVTLAISNDDAGFIQFLKVTLKPPGDEVVKTLSSLVELNVNLAQQNNAKSEQAYSNALTVTIVLVVGSVLFSILIGVIISRSISRPLMAMLDLATEVAGGNLTLKSDISSKDEVGQLAVALNRMVDNLKMLINNIVMNSQSVAASSEQISASTQEIASTSTSQSSEAGNISELFKELSLAINSVAASAEEAAELSNDTVKTAREGGHVVQTSLEGMQAVNMKMAKLEEDSRKIGDIIEVIDDIAEQTNLLALNAAIEAARAGEQGRGFAVVADEVRKLAERSGEATKEITTIIKVMQENTKQSVQAVADSVEQSSKTGAAFDQIIEMVNNSSQKVNEIAAACEEEAAQAAEVMSSVESISASSEESAAASEETAATCQSLAHLAEELAQSAAAFKTQ